MLEVQLIGMVDERTVENTVDEIKAAYDDGVRLTVQELLKGMYSLFLSQTNVKSLIAVVDGIARFYDVPNDLLELFEDVIQPRLKEKYGIEIPYKL